MSRLVVADAGPLIHLAQADALSLLELTGEVLVPKTVLDELEDGPTDISELDFSVEQIDIDTDSIHPHLEAGETAALVVCSDREAILLTDDMDARNTANEEGIEHCKRRGYRSPRFGGRRTVRLQSGDVERRDCKTNAP